MNRKEFLGKLGLGAAFVLTTACLGSCGGSNIDLTTINFTLDLTEPTNSALASNGGYIIKDKVVVAKNSDGNYVAATQLCSHEDEYEIILKNNEWFCTAHDARFGLDGMGLNSKGDKGLTIYKTSLSGDMLHIFF